MTGPAFEPLKCSRAGCRDAATWRIEWRNPRIHSADRRKTWVACDAHRDFLREYLAAREFPVSVFGLVDAAPDDGIDGAEGADAASAVDAGSAKQTA